MGFSLDDALKRRKDRTGTSSSGVSSAVDRYKDRKEESSALTDLKNRYSSLMGSYEGYKQSVSDRPGAERLGNSLKAQRSNMEEASALKRDLDLYKKYLGNDDYKEMSKGVENVISGYTGYNDAYDLALQIADRAKGYQQKAADAFTPKKKEEDRTADKYAVKSALMEQDDTDKYALKSALINEGKRQEQLAFDVEEGQKEVDRLKELADNASRITSDTEDVSDLVQDYIKSQGYGYTSIRDINESIKDREAYIRSAKSAQRIQSYEDDAINAPDFKEYSDMGAAIENPSFSDTVNNDTIFGKLFSSGSDVGNVVTFSRDNYDKINLARGDVPVGDAIYNQMTDKEVSVYNYWLAKEKAGQADAGTADEYLDSIRETLNTREAFDIIARSGLDSDTVSGKLLFGVVAGLDQFGSGMRNLFNTEDDYIPASPTQIASGVVRESLKNKGPEILGASLGQIGYDTVTTTSNMAPSLAAGALSGIGPVASVSLMGASAAGNEYAELLNSGMDKTQARILSTELGVWEAASEHYLGAIEGVGNRALSKAVEGRLKSGFVRGLGTFLIDSFQEGMEEVVQDIGSSIITGLHTGEYDFANAEELAYSFTLGALSAGVLNGARGMANVSNTAQTYISDARDIKGNTDALARLKETGNLYSADSVAYKLAGKLDENSGALTIAKALYKMDAQLSEQNKSDIKQALTERGVDEGNATTIADWLSRAVEGEEFNRAQSAALENNPIISDVFRDVIIDRNSSVNQRYNNLAEMRGMEADSGVDLWELSREASNSNLSRSANAAFNTASDLGVDYETLMGLDSDNRKTRKAAYTSVELGSMNNDMRATIRASRMSDADFQSIIEAGADYKAQALANKGRSISERKAQLENRVSENAKTTLETTGKEVTISAVDSITKDGMKLRLSDGSIVDSRDVSYKDSTEAVLYETVAEMGYPAGTANAIINGFRGATVPANIYLLGMDEAYRYGKIGYSDFSRSPLASELSDSLQKLGYDLGRKDAEASTRTAQEKVDRAKGKASKQGSITYLGSASPESLTGRQKVSVDTVGKVVSTLKNSGNIYFYASVKKDGVQVLPEGVDIPGRKAGEAAPNGAYDVVTGDIYIDLNAGNGGEGTILYTFSHELVHDLKRKSPEDFKKLADFLMQEYAKKGISVRGLIQMQIAKSSGRLSFDDAYEELVADSMEAMFTDADLAGKLAKLKATDKGLWNKIKRWFTELYNRIRGEYSKLEPGTTEGGIVKDMESLDRIAEIFAEGLVNADEVNVSDIGLEIDTASDSVAPAQMSERTWTQSEYMTEREATAKEITKQLDVSMEKAYRYIDDINSVAKLIADDRVRLDYDPNLDEKATVVKDNSEYKYTVDMSTLCAKRLLFTGTFDAIQKMFPNTAFTSEDVVRIRSMMEDRNYQVACGICYVESTRREIGPITQEFIKRYKLAQSTGKAITRLNSKGKPVDLKEKGTKKKFYAEKGYVPTLADLNTTDIDLVKRDHPQVYGAYLTFMNARGQAKPKLLETRTEYKGEILEHFSKKSAVDARNAAGGLRLQSFSDFEIVHLLDMMQITMDMARVGLKSQAYTKVPAFAEAFGNTGIKINLSLIAKGSGIDAGGNLIFDDVEGINHEEAFRLRDKFSKNVGTILVGKNDEHIIKAMADDRIDFIIPFHKSSWKESLYNALGLTGYDDYTATQNEKPIDNDRKIKNFAPSEYWDYSKTGDENAKIYLEKCREDGRIPKFPQFQSYPGYWKLLIDFKMYDNDGVGAEQKTVRPEFDNEVTSRLLKEYKGGHRTFPVAQDVVDDFAKEYKSKYSDRDTSDFAKGAEDYYGTTNNFELGGYLTVNGKMLDFSAGQRQRVIDHRDIADYYDDRGIELSNDVNEGMIRFMNDGNIRFQSHSGFELAKLPTKKQFDKLADIIDDYFYGNVSVDYSDETGRYLGTSDYEDDTPSTRIISDIRKHFEDGSIPEGTAKFSDRGVNTDTGESVKLSERLEAPPKKTVKAYKLMRLDENGLHPLFIDAKQTVNIGTWYNADSPDLSWIKKLGEGDYLVNLTNGESVPYSQYASEHGINTRVKPNNSDVRWAEDNGYRFMHIDDKSNTKQASSFMAKYGESKAYYNWGINGSSKNASGQGTASLYALRPGWHFGEVPSMRQIGYGNTGEEFRLDNQVWVEVEMSADVDYQAEAESNVTKDIPSHIPVNGYYTFATNPTQKKSKSGTSENDLTKADWYVAGAFKVVRILSDSEADSIVVKNNRAKGKNIPLDYRRQNGRVFNAKTMKLEDSNSSDAKLSDRGYASYTEDRIDRIIAEYGASSPNYAQAYVATISPRDFLKLTINDEVLSKWNDAEGKNGEIYPLDKDKLSGNTQSPFLTIEDGEVIGHEGRHRMRAMMNAGITRVPVIIRETSTKYSKKKMPEMTLTSQDFGRGNVNSGYRATITNLIPTNKVYRDDIISSYGRDSELKFSDRDSEGNTLTKAQQEYFKDSKVRDSEGNLLVMYHGTESAGFTRFDSSYGISSKAFFFTKDRSVARAYSGNSEIFQPVSSFSQLKNSIESVDNGRYAVEKNGNKYVVYDDGEEIVRNSDLQTTYNEWNDYSGWGGDSAVYATYLNAVNPLVVDAGNNNWDEIQFEGDTVTTNWLADYALDNGYDSVIINNVIDTGIYGSRSVQNSPTTDVIVFGGNQIKSTNNLNPTRNSDIRYSERDKKATDNRTLLANALETTATTEAEKKILAEYQSKISAINEQQNKLNELNSEIKRLSFAPGKRDVAKITELRAEANKAVTLINRYDKRLLQLESLKPLKAVLQREKAEARKKAEIAGKQMLEEYKTRAQQKQQEIIRKFKERTESRKATELRNKIKKYIEEFRQRLQNPTERRYIPSRLVHGVIDVYEAIDATGYNQDTKAAQKYRSTKEALTDLKLQYDGLKTQDYEFSSEFSEEFSQKISELAASVGDKPLRDMTRDELEDVYTILHDISAMITDATKQIGTADRITNYQAGSEIIADMVDIQRKGLTTGKIEKFFREWTLNPLRAVKEMSAYREDARLVKLFDDLNNGRIKADKFMMDSNKKFEAIMKTKEERKSFTDAVEKPYDFGLYDTDGNPVRISKMQAMQAILTYEREMANPNRSHLKAPVRFTDTVLDAKGKYSDAFDKGHDIVVDGSFIDRVNENLSEWDKRYLEVAREFFNKDSKDAVNEVSLLTKHRLVATEKAYIPYHVNQDYIAKESENIKFDATIENMGMLKSVRNNAPQQLVIRGLNQVVDDHIGKVAKVYGLTIPVRNFNKAYNVIQTKEDGGKPVKSYIGETWGTGGNNLITQAVADLQSSRKGANSKAFNAVKSAFVTSTLASNISVWMKQAASYPTAGSVLSAKSLVKALPDFARNLNSMWEEIDAKTPQHWTRRQGMSTQELGEANQTKGWQNRLNAKLGVWSPMNWIQAMDVKTTAVLWSACKYEVESMGIDKQSEGYWDEVTKLYNKVIEETQPMYDPLHRAEITKDAGLKNFIMFQTQPIQNSGILREGAMNYRIAKKQYGKSSTQAKEAGTRYRKAVTSQLASHFTFTAMTLLAAALLHRMNPWRDDDDELTAESISKEFGKELSENFIGAVIPVIGSYAFSLADKLFGGSRYDILSDPTVDKINTTIDNFSKLKNPTFESFTNMACDVATYFGIPAGNARNIINGIVLHTKDAINGELGSFEAGVERTATQEVNRSYKAFVNGDTELYDAIPVETSDITRVIKPMYVEAYNSGDTEEMENIENYLKSKLGSDDDVYWKLDQWTYSAETGSNEGYAKYDSFFTAVETGKDLKQVIAEYTANGVSEDTLKSQITSHFKPIYISLDTAGKASLKGYLLNAYAMLGADRNDREKAIKKWV